jgi:hypothetical protein
MKTLSAACVISVAMIGSGAWVSYLAARQASAKPASPAAAPSLSPDALDQLVAPIALYPDALLSNMLMCAADPGKLGALDEWLRSQATLTGSALQDAATAAGFPPSFVSLTVFPDVVAYMADQADWTRRLGQAFTTDRSGVFASIQRMRTKARTAGTLKSTPQQNVETRTASNGQEVIVIEPANPQVIYVPQYNPTVVYTPPATTVVVESNDSNAVAAGVIGFTAGIAIGAAIDNDYYYGPYGMRGGFYMYDDAWDDWYDEREDAREDWMDHREDLYEERGDQRENLAEERSERRNDVSEERTDRAGTAQEQRTQRQENRQATTQSRATTQGASRSTAAQTAGTSQEARGYSRDKSQTDRSGRSSDAFSGYSNGRSERAASERGNRSRSSSRGSGGSGGRRR